MGALMYQNPTPLPSPINTMFFQSSVYFFTKKALLGQRFPFSKKLKPLIITGFFQNCKPAVSKKIEKKSNIVRVR